MKFPSFKPSVTPFPEHESVTPSAEDIAKHEMKSYVQKILQYLTSCVTYPYTLSTSTDITKQSDETFLGQICANISHEGDRSQLNVVAVRSADGQYKTYPKIISISFNYDLDRIIKVCDLNRMLVDIGRKFES